MLRIIELIEDCKMMNGIEIEETVHLYCIMLLMKSTLQCQYYLQDCKSILGK